MENNTPNVGQEQELSELLQIRRDKLAALQAQGNDPFRIVKFDQQYYST